MTKLNILDKGYVRLVEVLGDDLKPVNAARVSYNKESKELTEKDKRLIKFLAREGHCYDGETEVLTNEGWIKWKNVTGDEKFASVDPEDRSFLGFEKPIDFVKEKVNEEMIRFKTPDVDLLVTEGHSLYCSLTDSVEKRKKPQFELHVANKEVETSNGTPTKKVYEKPMRMIKAAVNKKTKRLDDRKGIFKLYGFFIGDGHASKESPNRIVFHIKKQRKIDYLKMICEQLNLELRELANKNFSIVKNGIGIEFRQAFYTEDNKKTFPTYFFNMSYKEYVDFKEGLINSDGSKRRSAYIYNTTSKELADRLQALAALNDDVLALSKSNNVIRLNFSTRRRMPRLNDTENNRYYKEKYDGYVYCVTVSKGLLIVRRNGKVILCGNTSPFRHAILQFECYAPLMVARQWWKYIIGSGHKEFDGGLQDPFLAWNESSRRYITEEPEFYIVEPNEWRSAPDNSKQGSGEPVPLDKGAEWTDNLIRHYNLSVSKYEAAMEDGICAEQARLFLPAYGLYIRWYWTASLQAVCHLINQRLAADAQKEFQLYADAILRLSKLRFPNAVERLVRV